MHINQKPAFIFLSILMVGAFILRIESITTQGIVRWDEGMYMISSLDMSFVNAFAKPMHIYLVNLFTAIFGLEDYAGKLVSVVAGTLTVVVVYRIVRDLTTSFGGLVSSLLVASSFNYVYFSRLAHAQADSVLFLAIAILFFGRTFHSGKPTSNYAFSGFFMGLSFLTHPNAAPFGILLGFLCIYDWLDNARQGHIIQIKAPAYFAGALIFTVFSQEAISYLMGWESYIACIFRHNSIAVEGSEAFLYYWNQMYRWGGWWSQAIFLWSFLFCFVWVIIKRSRKSVYAFLVGAGPVIFWSITNQPIDNDRIYYSIVLGIFIMCGFSFGVSQILFSRLQSKGYRIVYILVFCVGIAFIIGYSIFNIEKSYLFTQKEGRWKTASKEVIRKVGEKDLGVNRFIGPPLLFYLYRNDLLNIVDQPVHIPCLVAKNELDTFLIRKHKSKQYPYYTEYLYKWHKSLAKSGANIHRLNSFGGQLYMVDFTTNNSEQRINEVVDITNVEPQHMGWYDMLGRVFNQKIKSCPH